MATPAQLYQDALNISNDWASRIQNGAILSGSSPQEKTFYIDLCAAVQMLAQAGLGASPSTVTLDTSDSNNVSTTTAASEASP